MTNEADDRPQAEAGKEYNPVFERLVDSAENQHGRLVGFIAYAFYKMAKREWAADIRKKQGRAPTAQELDAYVASWTPSRLYGVHGQAVQVLAEYANVVIREEESRILKEAVRGSFSRRLWPSVVAVLLCTLLIAGTAIVLTRSGVDLVGLWNQVAGSAQRSP
jgi:hypothetical protein